MDSHSIIKHLEMEQPHEKGPFDIIGDVHGCFDELVILLEKLGYSVKQVPEDSHNYGFLVEAPDDRKLAFVGDLVDRGPKIVEVLKLVMSMISEGIALCVPGNHDDKLYRKLSGNKVQVKNGLEQSMEQLEGYDKAFVEKVRSFLGALVHHYILDEGRLLISHAGLSEKLHGKANKSVRAFCLYGPTTGNLDEHGLPERINWAAEYCGEPLVVFGHTPVKEPLWQNNTVNIDTGCVYGGKLTALRYPEMEEVSVPALQTYSETKRPFK
ncbi:MAG: metallophosphoesterase [Hymenobacteraceae bacterium]|nr:metallophosphoesterase [Hymenobacteraceae bacterium]MDX5396765.1 metallophosphoesterase [Hymenobacteraceae bacterium]MDX5512827.1 metallophosphoesterase [Hymenobacteraceae bacterium]